MNVLNKVTRKTLSQNKVRTAVTIVGIMLSAAMFMAVMTSITSVQGYVLDAVKFSEGSYYATTTVDSAAEMDAIVNDPDLKESRILQYHGYAQIGSQNEYKPYLFIGGVAKDYTDLAAVNIVEGRMAENSGEIMLPKHLRDNGGVIYSIGDTITLLVGRRVWNGQTLTQRNELYLEDPDAEGAQGAAEELTDLQERAYTVVGFYSRPGWEPYSAPGYTALTTLDPGQKDGVYQVFYQSNKIKNISDFVSRIDPEWERSELNKEYVRAHGVGFNDGMNSMLYTMAGILSLLIMFGSISLIYNAFAISVSERTKQFGILKSIGATKKQMKRSVLYESLLLAAIGIPLGILAGILGMFITFQAIGGLFDMMLTNGENVRFTIHVKWWAVVVSSAVCLVTVLISAHIPAKRAAKKPAIDAIRQSQDIQIQGKRVKTWGITYKLFQFEGMLASKNFKRNKRKYRSTVISLFLSIVLFISASSFCGYMSKGVDSAANGYNYDISCSYYHKEMEGKLSLEQAERMYEAAKGVTSTVYYGFTTEFIYLSEETTPKEIWTLLEQAADRESGEYCTSARYAFMEDSEYIKYLEANGLDSREFMDSENPAAVVFCNATVYNGKFYSGSLLKDSVKTLDVKSFDEKDDDKVESDEVGHENVVKRPVGAYADKAPMGIDEKNYALYVNLIYPYSAIKTVLGEDFEIHSTSFYIKSDNPSGSCDEIVKSYEELGITGRRPQNIDEQNQVMRAVITIIKVFSYGFIVLISLISLANVFNTISTNVGLRRREFAMLKSVGMTRKGFNRMMNYECLLYGGKGTIYGLPVAVFLNWLMSRSLNIEVNVQFEMPWSSIAIAVGSVFLVVFATMLYSMSKIKHDNTIETLRRETA